MLAATSVSHLPISTSGLPLTEKDTTHHCVGIISCRILDVAEAKRIQLGVAYPTGGVNRKQDRPDNDGARNANRADDSEKSKKEIAI
jgi:hypothetical protein